MVQDILQYPHSTLRMQCEVCPPELVDQVVKDLLDTANHHRDRCAGLSANQIGYPFRIMVAMIGIEFVPFVNPKLMVYRDKGVTTSLEGCLSKEGCKKVPVRRHKQVRITDDLGKDMILKGFEARVVQHELDHFEGKCI